MKKISQLLDGECSNHIFPFLWIHGEEEEIIRKEILEIRESGIQAICVEARPHKDFLGDRWWKDIDIILDECKKRDMDIWILDDSHFPTGYANGRIEKEFPELRKRYLNMKQLDFFGPVNMAHVMIQHVFSEEEDVVVSACMAKKIDYNTIDESTLTDITAGMKDKKSITFHLPEGEWRIFIAYSSYRGGEKETEGYLNPIHPAGTDVLIDTVYEPFYKRYANDFGKTLKGFFSDEPRFGNVHGADASIGRDEMVLPWREDLLVLLDKKMGYEAKKYLPLLFVDGGNLAHELRYGYMDLISDMYAENFSGRLGKWCEVHGCEYIGHVIEDNNAHSRLGYGAGHFYKAIKGQHMSGIDVVLHQLLPGLDHNINKSKTSKGWDGEFFHYCLGKLGSSMGHMDPKKKGRTLCEVYGAYGWAEGNRLMKWITDYMLVRGVNEFVPHSFNPAPYPDIDCPPHFFAHGKNPQFQQFGMLMEYTNRMSHLLSDGVHHAPVMLVYHGEAEWSGNYMAMQKPAAVLTRNQIDFDILPVGVINDNNLVKAEERGSKSETAAFKVNQETFMAMVVPYAEAWPKAFLEKLVLLGKAGFPIYMLEQLPERGSEGDDVTEILAELKGTVLVVPLVELADALREGKIPEFFTGKYEPYLRYYHYEQPDGHIYMINNEHPYETISTRIEIAESGYCYQYDAMTNRLYAVEAKVKEGKTLLDTILSPYEAVVYIFTDEAIQDVVRENVQEMFKKKMTANLEGALTCKVEEMEISGPYKVSFVKSELYPAIAEEMTLEELVPLQEIAGKEDFCGIIRYETEILFEGKGKKMERIGLKLDGYSESARVFVNGKDCGCALTAPYIFNITEGLENGNNSLAIEVTTTLVRENYDFLSQWLLLEETGLTKKPVLMHGDF